MKVLIPLVFCLISLPAHAESGVASFYSYGPVACRGGHVGPMTAAHKTLPCGSRVRVTHGSRSVTVTITDRGPYVRGRIIDLSPDAARALGIDGIGHVNLERIK